MKTETKAKREGMEVELADPPRFTMNYLRTWLALLPLFIAVPALAEWHGPAFSLATPTLGQKQWSSDTVGMSVGNEDGSAFMFRQMIGYGITEDVQLNLNFPLSPMIDKLDDPPRTRLGMMMGGYTDVELSAMWRFHRVAPDVGKRYESTLLFSGGLPTEGRRGGVSTSPYLNAGVATGYASRTHYWWLGGGMQRNFERGDDRLGDIPYVTVAYGYRPPFFRRDFPKPDWRIFVEGVAEFPQRGRVDGETDVDSGGEKVLVGPSLLGLYGKWGISGGVLFPVHQRLNGSQADETFRRNWW